VLESNNKVRLSFAIIFLVWYRTYTGVFNLFTSQAVTLTSDTLFDLLMLKLKEAYTKKVKIESKGTVIYSKKTVASLPVQAPFFTA
jgi:hypothetical protein